MDLSTFLLLFIFLPYVFQPVLERALSPTIPDAIETADHVVICEVDQQGTRLIDELSARDVEYVVITESEEQALELLDADVPVIRGDPTTAATLENASIEDARAVVVDTREHEAASVILAVRELRESVRTIALVDHLEHRPHLRYAGADRVLTPRDLLGQRIAERITTEVSPARSDCVSIGESFAMLELAIFEDSPIHGETIGTVEARTDDSVAVIGMWDEGTFRDAPGDDVVVDETTALLVAGRDSDVRALERDTYRGREVNPTVLIAGYGVVGSTVRRGLQDSPAECIVVDVADKEGVDIVGDVTEESTLREASVDDATIFVLAIESDEAAILAVLLANHLTTDLAIIVRINDAENETKVRRAGGDYVLSLSEMSGRVLAEEVLHEDLLSPNRQLKTLRIDGARYAGRPIGETDIGGGGGVVTAIEREGELLTDVSPTVQVRDDDRILVIGPDEEIGDLAG